MKSHKWFTPWLLAAPAVIWVLVFGIWRSSTPSC